MVQIARQSFVLFQIAGAVVGAAGGDHIGAVHGPRRSTQQSRPLWIQYRQVLSFANPFCSNSFSYNGASMTSAVVIVICMHARGFNVACVTRSKAQRETCYSFRRRLVSTVRRQHGRGTGQLVASIAAGQLRVHAKPIIIIATAHRGFQRTQARH